MGLLWLREQHVDKAYIALEPIEGKPIPSVPTVLPTATDTQATLRERRKDRLKRTAEIRIDVAHVSLDARDGAISPASPESPPGVESPASVVSGPPSPASPGSPASPTALSVSSSFSTASTIAISTRPTLQPAILPTVTAVLSSTSSAEPQRVSSSSATATATATSTATSTVVSTSSTTLIKSALSTSSSTTAVSSSTARATTSSASRSVKALPLVTTDSTRAPLPTISNTASTSVATSTAAVTGNLQKEIDSSNDNTGRIGVHVVLPVIMSMIVAAGLLFFFLKWLQKRRQQKHSREDEGLPPVLTCGQDGLFITPSGQQAASTPPAHIPSDGSVMADLMNAVYRAEDGYRSSGVSAGSVGTTNEKMQAVADHQRRQLTNDRMTPTIGSSVFGWLSNLRSAAPTVRGSVATTVLPQPQIPAINTAEINAPRQPSGPWPEGFEAADPRFQPPPNVRYVSYWSESSGIQSPAKDGGHAPSIPSLPAGVSSYYAGITGSDTTSWYDRHLHLATPTAVPTALKSAPAAESV